MKTTNTAPYALLKSMFRPNFYGGDDASERRVAGFTPNQLRSAYSAASENMGNGMKIAVVSAFDSVEIENNMRVFCDEFSLPMPKMTLFFPDGRNESNSRRWSIEVNLDAQWAHAFAPMAEIYVVFAKNAETESLLSAAKYASKELEADVVSMSFGREESVGDENLADFFEASKSIFVASSGDKGSTISFPSSSPFCISVGGTKLDLHGDRRISEIAWQNSGGGISQIFKVPLWQGRFFNIYGLANGMRACPDVSMNADRSRGASVYDSSVGGWMTVGGSSLACACFAGVCACIKEQNRGISTSNDMLTFLYAKAGTTGYQTPQTSFFDITLGNSGKYKAETGWDFCTGLGSPKISNLAKYE